MFFGYDDETGKDTLFLQETDKCYTCNKNQDRCPLILCIANGLVNINDDELPVNECGEHEERQEGF